MKLEDVLLSVTLGYTMKPAHMQWMAKEFPRGLYHYCPNGSHLAMWNDE
ncbi:MAG: hypothetical protein U5J83_09100 [Bryobacterales bacterium]|nr:hypothetical protein [Bryobacterales bacterium]